MTAVLKPVSRMAALTFAAVAVAATGGGVASADIPGETRATTVFPIDNREVQLAVNAPNLANGTVTATIQNNTDNALACKGLDEPVPAGTKGPAGTVVPDHIVARSVDFYSQYPYSPLLPLPVIVKGATSPEPFGLGSVTALAPGSLAELFWPDLGALKVITDSYDEARIKGQVGVTPNVVNVPARTSQNVIVPLEPASAGGFQNYSTGIMLTCELKGQRYVFHGYQNGRPANLPEPSDEIGRFTGS